MADQGINKTQNLEYVTTTQVNSQEHLQNLESKILKILSWDWN